MREQREILEDQADRTLFGRQEHGWPGNLAVVEQHAAGGLGLDAGGDPEQRRLAGAGWPEQAQHLARLGATG